MTQKFLFTIKEMVASHSRITERDLRQCIKGTHPTLPPLRAKTKNPGSSNSVYLITAEDAARWRDSFPDA